MCCRATILWSTSARLEKGPPKRLFNSNSHMILILQGVGTSKKPDAFLMLTLCTVGLLFYRFHRFHSNSEVFPKHLAK